MFTEGRPALIGMIHVGALPGTPRAGASLDSIIAQAVAEAGLMARAGFDALLVENMHDAPFLAGEVGPEIVAAMTAVGVAVRAAAGVPLGVQILAAANREAVAVALASGADFVRVENFAFAHVADEGLMPLAAAGPLLRYRRAIGADSIRILADIRKKHASHAITSDLDLPALARAAEFCGAEGVILTGAHTGAPPEVDDFAGCRDATRLPLIAGSGITAENLGRFWSQVDGLIVGSELKRDGLWSNPICESRVERFVAAARALRG